PVLPPDPVISFRKYANRWVDGTGYNIIRGVGSYEACENYCRSDSSCRMFEYYFGKEDGGRKCNLFSHTRIEAEGSTEAHVGIRQ
ncbi:PAN domain-containing protein, partial [Acinetobacter baumannii]